MPQPPIGETSHAVAANVRRIRSERGLTIDELAKAVRACGHQITAATLGKIERAERRVDVDDAMAIAGALGVPLGSLFVPAGDLGDLVQSRIEAWASALDQVEEIWVKAEQATAATIRIEGLRWQQMVELGLSSAAARARIEAGLSGHRVGGPVRVAQYHKSLEGPDPEPWAYSVERLTSGPSGLAGRGVQFAPAPDDPTSPEV